MIAHVNSVTQHNADVVLPREWARLGQDILRAHALNILAAASLTRDWEPGSVREDDEAETVTVRCHRKRGRG